MTTPTMSLKLQKLSVFQSRVPGHRSNGRLHPSTIIRWITRGVGLPDGTRMCLKATRAGSRWLCCDAWFEEFLAALTAAHIPVSARGDAPVRSPAQRNDAAANAARELERLGA